MSGGLDDVLTAQDGTLAATPTQASWATAPATRPRARMTDTDFILIMGWLEEFALNE